MRNTKFKKKLTPQQNAAHDRHHDAWSPVCCHRSNNQPDLCPCHTPHTALLVGLLICSAMYYILHWLFTVDTLQCAVWKCLSALHSMSSHTHLTEVCSALCSACSVVSFFFSDVSWFTGCPVAPSVSTRPQVVSEKEAQMQTYNSSLHWVLCCPLQWRSMNFSQS